MADYIDRQALDVVAFTDRDGTFSDGIQWLLEYIDTLPSADVQPVRHGHWIYTPTNILGYVCSECGNGMCRFNYCPHCGALMDEVT